MKNGQQHIIGFGGQFWTHWTSYTWEEYRADGTSFQRTSHTYLRNLSHTLEEAEEEMKRRGITDYIIDEDLRGEKWTTPDYEREQIAPHLFSIGELTNQPIMESDNLKYLFGAYFNDSNARRRVYARRRLIKLGELIKHPHTDDNIKRTYMSTKRYNAIIERAGRKHGYFYEDGERIEIKLKEVGSFHFETVYGFMYIVTYLDETDRVFKYKGSNPPDISLDEFVLIKGTVKHSEYKGKQDTMLQRIKTL